MSPRFFAFLFFLFLTSKSGDCKNYTKCEFAQELQKLNVVEVPEISLYTCISDTVADLTPLKPDTTQTLRAYGYFRILNKWWCSDSSYQTPNFCKVACKDLLNLAESVKCAQLIRRVQKDSWDSVEDRCRNKTEEYSECVVKEEEVELESVGHKIVISSDNRPPFTITANRRILSKHPTRSGIHFRIPVTTVTNFEFICQDKRSEELDLPGIWTRLKASDYCLNVTFGEEVSDETESWSISGSATSCQKNTPSLILHNCSMSWSNNTIKSLGWVDDGPIPEPYSIGYIAPQLKIHIPERAEVTVTYAATLSRNSPLLTGLCYMKPHIRRVVIISPGFKSRNSVSWVENMKNAIISKSNSDTIVVRLGWENGANLWFWQYKTAVANTMVVGQWLGDTINRLRKELNSYTEIYGIGFSLGAHLIGKAGRSSRSFNRITGLDPAGPSFEGVFKQNRLTKNDADFVDIIHTDGSWGGDKPDTAKSEDLLNPVGHYGTIFATGDMDFYPNWGFLQPNTLKGNLGNWIGMNSHKRAHELFTWSILHPGKLLTNYEIPEDPTLSKLPSRKVLSEHTLEMGYFLENITRGNFYIETSHKEPWDVDKGPLRETHCSVRSTDAEVSTDDEDDVHTEMIDCDNMAYHRVRITADLISGHTKYSVLNYNNIRRQWVENYAVYWHHGRRSADLATHSIQPRMPGDPRSGNFAVEFCRCQNADCTEARRICREPFTGIRPDISSAYSKRSQQTSFNNQVFEGFQKPDGTSIWLEKGHLVPYADFGNVRERTSTYLYMNAAPHWSTVNNGNWGNVEDFLRVNQNAFTKVYTVQIGNVLARGGNPVHISSEGGAWTAIPIPRFLVKVVVRLDAGNNYLCSNTIVVENIPQRDGRPNDCAIIPGLNRRLTDNQISGVTSCFNNVPDDVYNFIVRIVGVAEARRLRGLHDQTCFL